mmetsp:Transcript_8656/g.23794  ORF Transcript_8656/g.23794 Transcript_8656/m.23794 type:complete len:275 (-) Transcript_8656:266-1090(-)
MASSLPHSPSPPSSSCSTLAASNAAPPPSSSSCAPSGRASASTCWEATRCTCPSGNTAARSWALQWWPWASRTSRSASSRTSPALATSSLGPATSAGASTARSSRNSGGTRTRWNSQSSSPCPRALRRCWAHNRHPTCARRSTSANRPPWRSSRGDQGPPPRRRWSCLQTTPLTCTSRPSWPPRGPRSRIWRSRSTSSSVPSRRCRQKSQPCAATAPTRSVWMGVAPMAPGAARAELTSQRPQPPPRSCATAVLGPRPHMGTAMAHLQAEMVAV